ncbi:transketolase [Pseudodesulfovibrio sp.]|uniref:transketolase n=1 Tax=unclassified Pseudodesulfovibrio TaxID=2661612 RepID=UPI003B00AC5C
MIESIRKRHEASEAQPLDARSIQLREMVVDTLECAERGHIGSSMSLIEIMRVLYDDILRFDPKRPDWSERDRCILSKGHGCLAQYVMLADKGFFPKGKLTEFCACNGLLGGHPCATKIPGVEVSTGALGHGLPVGVGMALDAKVRGRKNRVFVVMGDGECNEGSVWEAAMSAGKRGLDNLVAMVDYNKYQSYGQTSAVQELEPFADKWEAFGFHCVTVNGHDVDALKAVLSAAPFVPGRPSAVICDTVKGKGIQFAENNPAWHHKSKLPADDITAMRRCLEG